MKKYYLIESNSEEEKYWSFVGGKSGNGGWEKVGSYYFSEEEAQKDIDNGIDGHIIAEEF